MRFTSTLLKKGRKAPGKPKPPKIAHPPFVFVHLPAGQASPAPPLGPQVGSRGVNVQNFCKDFNKRTSHIQEGVPLPCHISVNPDRSFELDIGTPLENWLIFRAAGIRRGSENGETEAVGQITRKHLFEIARIKSQDTYNRGVPLEILCQRLAARCFRLGVRIHDSVDPDAYRVFLEARKARVKQQLEAAAERKAQKMLRTA